MIIYHGSYCTIEKPEIRKSQFNKDFGQGFYCTQLKSQAERWARKFKTPIVSVYEYTQPTTIEALGFPTMTEEWLDFIIDCLKYIETYEVKK